jgi:56kDa selenium binding protein (SBP56).
MSQYDGLALSEDGKYLYFSTWVNGNVGKIDIKDKKVENLILPIQLTGPADFSIHNGKLYIPDLPNSKVLVY